MEGYGEMLYADGRRYEGGWLQGEYHGRGVKLEVDGTVVRGEWHQGTKL